MSYSTHPSSIPYFPRPDSYEYSHEPYQAAGYHPPCHIFSHSYVQHRTPNPSVHTHNLPMANAFNHVYSRQVSLYTNSSDCHMHGPLPLRYSPIPSYSSAVQEVPQYKNSSAEIRMHRPYSQNLLPPPHRSISAHPAYFYTPQLGSHIPSYVCSSTNHHFGANACHTTSNNSYVKHLHYNRPILRSTGASAVNNTKVNSTENMEELKLSSVKESKESELCEFDFSSRVSDKVLWEEIYGELPEIVKLPPLFPELEQESTMK